MEGGLLIHAAWLLSFVFVWVYRRYFEKIGPRDEGFERLCRDRPVLAAVRTTFGDEASVVAAMRTCIPSREVIASFGGWPWTHYVLAVSLSSGRGVVRMTIEGCRRLRSREERPPAVHVVLARVARAHAPSTSTMWLHPGAYVDVRGCTHGVHGWQIAFSTAAELRFEPSDGTPGWVAPDAAVVGVSDFRRAQVVG